MICWRRDRLPTPVFLGFPGGSDGKESACSAGDLGSIPELGRSRGEGNLYPLHYYGWKNSMDCVVHGVTKSPTQLSDFCFSSFGSSLLFGLFFSCSKQGLVMLCGLLVAMASFVAEHGL